MKKNDDKEFNKSAYKFLATFFDKGKGAVLYENILNSERSYTSRPFIRTDENKEGVKTIDVCGNK